MTERGRLAVCMKRLRENSIPELHGLKPLKRRWDDLRRVKTAPFRRGPFFRNP